jgi:hypothetical protein
MLVDALLVKRQSERIDRLRAITRSHPNYWPAWFELGDRLAHHGTYLGVPLDEARAALRRTTALNPRFVPAWQHLFWSAITARDTIESGRALQRLGQMRADSALADEPDLQLFDYYRYLDRLARTHGRPDPNEAEIGARVLSSIASAQPERLAATFTDFGFHRAQLDLSRRVAERASPATAAAHVWGAALAWAGRGGWDSAAVYVTRYARITGQPAGPLRAYGLGVMGMFAGSFPASSIGPLRQMALRSKEAGTESGRAELAWLDGLLACVAGDQGTLRQKREALDRSSVGSAPALARSLRAFELIAAGDSRPGARALMDLESENADASWDFRFGAAHPLVSAVNRLAAARLSLEEGDTAAAAQLLHLHESNLPTSLQPLPAILAVAGSASLSELANVARAQGDSTRARTLRDRARAEHDIEGKTRRRVCGG